MRKLPNFKDHNCYCEQIIAYNYLFTHADINGLSLNTVLQFVDNSADKDKLKRYDITAIKSCITKNFDHYTNKPFIAGSYAEVAEKLPL